MEWDPPSHPITGGEGGRALVNAHDHSGDVATVSVVEGRGISALELARMACRPGGFGRRLIGSLLVAPLCTVIALHRQTRDLPGSLGAFFEHRRLCVSHGNDLAAA